MKRHFSLRFFMTLAICCIASMAHALVEFTVGDLYYYGREEDKTAWVKSSSYYASLTTVNIPKNVTYDKVTYTVTSVGYGAFKNCTALKTVTLSSGLQSIDNYAFYGCTSLTSISIPASVTRIYNYAFYGCTALKTVTLNNGLTTLDSDAFNTCTALTAISIPASLTALPDNAFMGCTSLKTVTMPSKAALKSIGSGAFSGCTSLTAITIPDSVAKVQPGAFAGCSALTTVHWNAISSADTNGNWSTFNDTYTPFRSCPAVKTFTFGSTVTKIPNYLCHSLSGLTEVTIPASATSIGYGVFAYCTNLKKVTYNAVKASYSMGSYYPNLIFYECPNLTSVTFGNDVQTIPGALMLRCKRIKKVTIPAKVTSVGASAFAECDSLTTVVWNAKSCAGPYNSDSGGPFCFNAYLVNNGNNKIKTFIFGEGVEDIPTYLCYNMDSLENVTLPSTVKKIGNYAFYSCNRIQNVTLPTGLTTIGNAAFCYCRLQSVNLPTGLITIGDEAFRGCGLQSVIFPSTLTTIGNLSFSNNSFTSVHIPASLTSIAPRAFNNLSLETITVADDNPVYDSRDGCNAIVETATNKLLKGCIYGTIPSSVTAIGDYAFSTLICEKMEIPGSVTNIGAYAFSTGNVKTLVIPASVTSIGSYAFNQSKSTLTNIETIKCYITDPTAVFCKSTAFTGIVDKERTAATVCRLLVPEGTTELYSATSPWSLFTDMSEFLLGDLNQDGAVNAGDVSALFAVVLGGEKDGYFMADVDLNGDGVVNAGDVSALYSFIIDGSQVNSKTEPDTDIEGN